MLTPLPKCMFLLILAAMAAPGRTTALEGVTSVGGRPVADAVVWLDAPQAPRPSHPVHAVMDQRNLSFLPHVLAIRTGTIVDFPNNDRVFHNVFSFHDGKKFDLGLYPVGFVKHVPFNQSGLSRLFCNIHPQMGAYIMAVDTPYFAVSDSRGRFVVRDVPEGSYTYHAWHPGGATLTGVAAVRPSERLTVQWPKT